MKREITEKKTRSQIPSNTNVCDANNVQSRTDVDSERVFPCRSNAEVREALMSTLLQPHVEVEIAGGIVRHHVW